MQLYVNGELVDSNDYTGGLGTTSGGDGNQEPWTLGASQTHSDDEEADHMRDYYEGELDEFAIYDHALSAAEIESLYSTGAEDSGNMAVNSFPLDIDAALVDTDGSESLSITVGGIPDGATLSAGTDNGNGTWTLATEDLEGLAINVDTDGVNDFDLTVTATSTESASGDTASTTATVTVDVPEQGFDRLATSHTSLNFFVISTLPLSCLYFKSPLLRFIHFCCLPNCGTFVWFG